MDLKVWRQVRPRVPLGEIQRQGMAPGRKCLDILFVEGTAGIPPSPSRGPWSAYGRYEYRLPRYPAKMRGQEDERFESQVEAYHHLLKAAIDAERRTIVMLRDQGRISNDAMHRIERDLDLEDSRHAGDQSGLG